MQIPKSVLLLSITSVMKWLDDSYAFVQMSLIRIQLARTISTGRWEGQYHRAISTGPSWTVYGMTAKLSK